jgi:hypothetical protein
MSNSAEYTDYYRRYDEHMGHATVHLERLHVTFTVLLWKGQYDLIEKMIDILTDREYDTMTNPVEDACDIVQRIFEPIWDLLGRIKTEFHRKWHARNLVWYEKLCDLIERFGYKYYMAIHIKNIQPYGEGYDVKYTDILERSDCYTWIADALATKDYPILLDMINKQYLLFETLAKSEALIDTAVKNLLVHQNDTDAAERFLTKYYQVAGISPDMCMHRALLKYFHITAKTTTSVIEYFLSHDCSDIDLATVECWLIEADAVARHDIRIVLIERMNPVSLFD